MTLEKLWKAYKFDGDQNARDEIIKECVPLVRASANRLATFAAPSHDAEDLVSAGIIGLLDAMEKFDPTKGASFKTYAGWRIRGAILDEVRALDWVPRSVREKAKKLERVYFELEQSMLRPPSEEEIAGELGISLNELHKTLSEVSCTAMLMLDEICQDKENEDSVRHYIEDPRATSAIDKLVHEETKHILAEAIDSLPEQEKLTITLYYYEELTMKEVGKVLKVSESRICQIHSSAIIRLRSRLKDMQSSLAGSGQLSIDY